LEFRLRGGKKKVGVHGRQRKLTVRNRKGEDAVFGGARFRDTI